MLELFLGQRTPLHVIRGYEFLLQLLLLPGLNAPKKPAEFRLGMVAREGGVLAAPTQSPGPWERCSGGGGGGGGSRI